MSEHGAPLGPIEKSSVHTAGGMRVGATILGAGMALPRTVFTNADLEKLIDTTDDWIQQRTGIRERRVARREYGETTASLGARALQAALDDAGMRPTDLDQIVVATTTPDMPTPATACQIAAMLGAGTIAGFDLNAACSGFVFALNTVDALIRSGVARNVGVVGSDLITRYVDYTNRGRGTSILFGDGAGAFVIAGSDDPDRGVLARAMHTDGSRWPDLFIPRVEEDYPPDFDHEGHGVDINCLHMNGRAVFKFAVSTFSDLIQETLDKVGLRPEDVDHYVCHQSNKRILDAARERFGLPEEKLHINIDRYGNTVAASVGLCFTELKNAGRVRPGQLVMFLGFGAGLTWGSSLWRL
ncbi:MAG: ketoacyl-ACP synthase III [Phycisphaeraceae bacterium]|nr:ketoacyl-ACP synthase III [Phycisphaeraceae bacterium]